MMSGLGGYDDFIPVVFKGPAPYTSEQFLGRPAWGAVVVGQVEIRHAMVEGIFHYLPTLVRISLGSEILPESKGNLGKENAAPSAAAVLHHFITRGCQPVVFHISSVLEQVPEETPAFKG